MAICNRKKDILLFTWQSITQNGIRAFRVEELARVMGMSKRTIYRLFSTKTDLLKTCLIEINQQFYSKQIPETIHDEGDPFIELVNFLKGYIVHLHQVKIIFLMELKQLSDFVDIYQLYRREWLTRVEKLITNCQQKDYILSGINVQLFCERLLTALFESRLEGIPHESLFILSHTLLRGISTYNGIVRLEKIKIPTLEN